MSEIKRGDLYWYDFGEALDARQAGKRPALIIQSDVFNQNESYPLTIVLPVTTKGRRFHVPIPPDKMNGLTEDSFVKCEQPNTILKSDLGPKIGFVAPGELVAITSRLKDVLGT